MSEETEETEYETTESENPSMEPRLTGWIKAIDLACELYEVYLVDGVAIAAIADDPEDVFVVEVTDDDGEWRVKGNPLSAGTLSLHAFGVLAQRAT